MLAWLIKLALVIAVVLFGGFMMAFGLVLSGADLSRLTLNSLTENFTATEPSKKSVHPTDTTSTKAADSSAAQPPLTSTDSAPEKKAATSKTKSKSSIPIAAVMLPQVPTSKTEYSLQIGLYAQLEQAAGPLQQLKAAKQKPQWFTVTDEQHMIWHLLSVGKYHTTEEAQQQAYHLLNHYGLPSQLMQLPTPPSKGK